MFGYISKNELKLIDEYFQQYIKFTQYKQNNFNYIEKTGNKDLDELFHSWNEKIKMTDASIKSDINVIGEIVLTADKVNQGIFKSRVKSELSGQLTPIIKTSHDVDFHKKRNKQLEKTNSQLSSDNEKLRKIITSQDKGISISETRTRELTVLANCADLAEQHERLKAEIESKNIEIQNILGKK